MSAGTTGLRCPPPLPEGEVAPQARVRGYDLSGSDASPSPVRFAADLSPPGRGGRSIFRRAPVFGGMLP